MNLEYWKEVKKQKKMTIAEIAERANLPKGSVQNIFAGYVPSPRIDTVEAIERALGIDDHDSLTPEERAAGAVEAKRVNVTPIEDELLYLFRQLGIKRGSEAQRSILTVIENML